MKWQLKAGVLLMTLQMCLSASASSTRQQASLSGWTWPPYIVLPLAFLGILYGIGILKVRAKARWITLWPAAAFAAGWLSLLIALDSPIHKLSEQLFWVNMTQHEILMLVSAPLLVLSRPLIPFLWALPQAWREPTASLFKANPIRKTWFWISAPLAAWLLQGAVLWGWHVPLLFDATLRSDLAHAAQHISFLGSALLFWWALIHGRDTHLGYGVALLYVFTTAIHTSVLGALMTFAASPWYSAYLQTTARWGLSPLEDQQIGGLIMWIPAGTLLLAISLGLLVKWMQESGRRWEYTRTAELLRSAAEASHEA